MDLYKNRYRIQSTRLKEWDYSSDGYYFVTICTKDQEFFFGNIVDGRIKLSAIGEIAKEYWLEIPQHFQNVKLDEFVIMPNHVHGIVIIENDKNKNCRDSINKQRGKDDINCRDGINAVSTGGGKIPRTHNPMLSKNSLSKIIRWYKGRCTFEINRIQNKLYFAWQSRFYEHIIRNEESLLKIREYIHNNPLKWDIDENNPAVFLKKKE